MKNNSMQVGGYKVKRLHKKSYLHLYTIKLFIERCFIKHKILQKKKQKSLL